MKKWTRIIAFSVFAPILSVSIPSGALASPPPKTEDLNSLGTATPNEERSTGLSAEAHLAERIELGSFVSVTWSIENLGSTSVFFNWPAGTSYMYRNSHYFSGVTVTSSSGAIRHHPIMDENGDCLCSGSLSFDFKERINPGEQVAYWSMYSVPEDVDTITLEIPGFEPIEDIPIS